MSNIFLYLKKIASKITLKIVIYILVIIFLVNLLFVQFSFIVSSGEIEVTNTTNIERLTQDINRMNSLICDGSQVLVKTSKSNTCLIYDDVRIWKNDAFVKPE